jgi:hypothetical protein
VPGDVGSLPNAHTTRAKTSAGPWLRWVPIFEVLKKLKELDQRRSSFETAAELVLGPRTARTRGRLPQDDENP